LCENFHHRKTSASIRVATRRVLESPFYTLVYDEPDSLLYHVKWYSSRSGLAHDSGLRVRDHVVHAGGDADGDEDAGDDRHDDGGALDEGLDGLAVPTARRPSAATLGLMQG
jgi:hypothetical protein